MFSVGMNGLVVGAKAQRLYTNLLLRSDDFSTGSFWAKVGVNSIGASGTTPTLVEDGSNGTHAVQQTFTNEGYAGIRTFSAYLKASGRTWGLLSMTFDTGFAKFAVAWFNLGAGTAGTVSSNPAGATSAIQTIGGGFYRCSVSLATTLNVKCSIAAASGDAASTYQGTDGTTAILMTGAMLENHNGATTYYRT